MPFTVNHQGYVVQELERRLQSVVPHKLQTRVLHLAYFPKLAAHPGRRKLYYTLRKDFCSPAMSFEAYESVRGCFPCGRSHMKLRKYSKKVMLVPGQAPLTFIGIDQLVKVTWMPRSNRYLVDLTDRFSNITRTVPLKRNIATTVAQTFFIHCVFTNSPPIYLLSENGSQFPAKFFHDVCRILEIRNWLTKT